MEVRFEKSDDGRTCGWTAVLPHRERVPGPTMAAGGDVPHDLATFVIEEALGIEHGFWGCVAAGARFRSLGRRRTPQGKEVVSRHRAELDRAEERVNEVYWAWRRGEPTPVDEQLDGARRAWQRLGGGDELVLTWPTTRRR